MLAKSQNWPFVAFLLALMTSVLLFIPDWGISVQQKYGVLASVVAGIMLPLFSIWVFWWSYKQSIAAKSKNLKTLNVIGLTVITAWLLFSIFAILMGIVLSSVLDKGFSHLPN